jgi:carbonic anhydrase
MSVRSDFSTPKDGVHSSVVMVRVHPLLLRDVPVHGLMIDPETGRLDPLVNGYEP